MQLSNEGLTSDGGSFTQQLRDLRISERAATYGFVIASARDLSAVILRAKTDKSLGLQ